ncbi:MAG: RNA polymerase sigma factor [Chthoniobacterales bacterium]
MNEPDALAAADSDAMQRLRDGDDLALNDLMARWQQPLVRHIFRYTQNEADALDLAQETFVRIYQHRAKYDTRARFSTWLYTIATRLCRNQARWKLRHPAISLELESSPGAALEDTLSSPGPTPDQQAGHRELDHAIAAAFAALPDDQRTAALLQTYEALPSLEIARILGCSAKAIEGKLYRARQFLREKLSPWVT